MAERPRFSPVRLTDRGALYAARDRYVNGRPHPEHAVWSKHGVHWYGHPEGGIMSPFAGPYQAWKELAGG